MDYEDMKMIVKKGIPLLRYYHDCFCWTEFGNSGNACYDPLDVTDEEAEQENLWIAAVKTIIPRNSKKHALLNRIIAHDIGCKWVTYNMLATYIARILSGQSLEDILHMCKLSRIMRHRMRVYKR